MKKTLSSIALVLLIAFGMAECVSRLLVVDLIGTEFVMGRPWRYMLPIRYKGRIDGPSSADTIKPRTYDSLLGWSHHPWSQAQPFFYDDFGFRCSEAESKTRTPGLAHYDIICIGNSFTHGDAVAFEDTWPHLLSRSTGRSVLNMGVGGYGIDQAVLRFMNSNKTCDTVILGLIPGDLERSLTTVYNYYLGGVKTKPKFSFKKEGGYSLLNVPCLTPAEFVQRPVSPRADSVYKAIDGYNGYVTLEEKWWTRSQFLRLLYSSIEQVRHRRAPIYMTPSAELDYCLRIFEVFKQYCDSKGVVPVVLLMDNLNSIGDRIKAKDNTWSLLQKRLDAMGLVSFQFQDSIMSRYQANPGSVIHPTEKVHYSPEGNRILSELLSGRL